MIEGTIAVHLGVSAVSSHEKSNFVFFFFSVRLTGQSFEPFLETISFKFFYTESNLGRRSSVELNMRIVFGLKG